MSVGRQITDGSGLSTKYRPSVAGMAEQNLAYMMCLSDVARIKPKASETYGHAGHCKQTVQGP